MTPIDPATPIAVTLEAQQWNQVVSVLGDGPWRIVNPLINRIAEQVQTAAGQMPQPQSNGADSHAPD